MKVEFSAFPKAFSGNVAVFVGADKQLQATAKAIDGALGGALGRAIEASRFTGAKNQTLTVLGQADFGRLTLLGTGKPRDAAESWEAMARALGQWAMRGHGLFAVEHAGVLVGHAGVLSPPAWPCPEIAYAIAPAAQRREIGRAHV